MSWPASYFTGPLGADNVVPASETGALLMLWSGTSTTNADSRTLIQSRITASGRTPDCIGTKIGPNLSTDDSYSTGGTSGRGETWINSLGAVPIISWDWNVTPASVASGAQDTSLATVASRFAAANYRIILRLWREQNIQSNQNYFTGDTSNTAPQLAQIAADWKAGWQYVVNYFHNYGATNVGFCWCPSEKANRNNVLSQSGRDQLLATYPGDAYVDWIGADGYNHSRTGVYSTPTHDGWSSFNEVFNYHTLGYANLALVDEYTTKPFYVWETGSKYDSGTASRKATWFTDIDDVAKDSMPRLQGVQFFDEWVSGESNDWRVDHNQIGGTGIAQGSFDQTTYDGWLNLANRARWKFGVAPMGGGTSSFVPTVWVNNTPPPLSAANLNKLTNELKAQAVETNFVNTLPTWVDGAAPALTDAAALNEIERCLYWISNGLGLTYVRTTWGAGWTPGRNAYQFNKMEQQLAANRAVLDAAPPPVTTAYFVEDWSTGRAETARWDAFYSYSGTGAQSTPLSATTDGRVAVVNDPARAGRKALRVEIRDTDPKYPNIASGDKSECTSSYSKTWGPGGFPGMGVIRWFDFEMYFPYNATEKYEWPHNATGGASWALFGLHPPGGSTAFWSAIHVEWNPYQFRTGGEYANWQNVYLNFHAEGGTWNGGGSNPNDFNYHVMPMTDANGNRLNYDRWVRLVFGVKFNPDNTGWLEIWCDDQTPGVLRNVVPRVNRPTAWDVDVQYYQSYFKYGIYDNDNTTTFPSGASVMYFGRTTIGPDRPF